MADYDPNVPSSGSENISTSNPKINNNFTQLNNIFDFDHYKYNNSISSQRGLHRQLTFPAPLVTDPGTSTTTLSVYSKADVNDSSARPQLYCQNINGVNNVKQITNRFINTVSNSGYLMLPGGTAGQAGKQPLIIMWGVVSIASSSSSGQIDVTLPSMSNFVGAPVGFPNQIFNVQLTTQTSSSANQANICIDTSSFANDGFQIRYSQNSLLTFVYWVAIGT